MTVIKDGTGQFDCAWNALNAVEYCLENGDFESAIRAQNTAIRLLLSKLEGFEGEEIRSLVASNWRD